MGKPSKGKKSENLGKGMVTPVQIAFIVDRYLCDNNYLVTRFLFRTEASSLIAKSPIQEAPKSLLSVMNTYNVGGSPAVSAPPAIALKSMLMATPSHPFNGSAAGMKVWIDILGQDLFCNQTQFRFVASKVATDGFLFGPLDLLVFFTYMGFSSGKSFPQFKEDGKRDFLPAFVLEGGVWPIVQLLNFLFTPVRYQLLYVNFFCLLDNSFLSWLEQQQDASWKQWLKSRVLVSKQKGEGD